MNFNPGSHFLSKIRIDDDYNFSKLHTKGNRNLTKLEGRRNEATKIRGNNAYIDKIHHISSFGNYFFVCKIRKTNFQYFVFLWNSKSRLRVGHSRGD